MKGSYILLLRLRKGQDISVGSLKTICFPEGCYAYVGSALNGIEPRIRRHLSRDKKIHWHIDYLLSKVVIADAVFVETDIRTECVIAQELSRQFVSVPYFGSSDCSCLSHLFSDSGEMKSKILTSLNRLTMKPRILREVM